MGGLRRRQATIDPRSRVLGFVISWNNRSNDDDDNDDDDDHDGNGDGDNDGGDGDCDGDDDSDDGDDDGGDGGGDDDGGDADDDDDDDNNYTRSVQLQLGNSVGRALQKWIPGVVALNRFWVRTFCPDSKGVHLITPTWSLTLPLLKVTNVKFPLQSSAEI